MNSVGLTIAASSAALVILGSRRWAVLAILCGLTLLPMAQFVAFAGFNLFPMRVLLLAALARIALRREWRGFGWTRLDTVFVLAYAYTVAVFVLRSDEDIAFRIGWGLDAVGLYLAFRMLVRDADDLRWLLQRFVLALLALAVAMAFESVTFRNLFASLGGVELAGNDEWVRGDRLRALASFGHPSLAGTIGGSFLALYLGALGGRRGNPFLALIGAASCLLIVWAANSGGPVTCVAVAALGWLLWPMRLHMKIVRRALLATFVALGVAMNAPIWYLLARISDVTGGGGYHRAALMDVAFRELDKWWLVGMSMQHTKHWLPYTNGTTGVVDLTNNYLNFGVASGLLAMALFIALIVSAFKHAGRAMAAERADSAPGDSIEPLQWGLGVALTVHVVNWFGITYWDQSAAFAFLHFAMIGSQQTGRSDRMERAESTASTPVAATDIGSAAHGLGAARTR